MNRTPLFALWVVAAVPACLFDSGNDTDLVLTVDGAVSSHTDVSGDGTQVSCDDDGHIDYAGAPATPTLAVRVTFPADADDGDTFALGSSPPPADLVVAVDIDGAPQTILRGTLTVLENGDDGVTVEFTDTGDNARFRLDGVLDCDGFSFDDGDADLDSDSD
jgi:hypothetical protein